MEEILSLLSLDWKEITIYTYTGIIHFKESDVLTVNERMFQVTRMKEDEIVFLLYPIDQLEKIIVTTHRGEIKHE